MKKETYAEKLAKLLGLTEAHEKVTAKAKPKIPGVNHYEGVTEDEIQSFRQAQGIIYFLQAPALFTSKVCKHCGADFLVSRQFVGFCSYTCIRKSLNEMGFEWKKGDDLELLIADTYEGNEPVWIRNGKNLKDALEKLHSLQALSSSPMKS